MQERLNDPLDKVKIAVISFILTIGWLTLGCYFPVIYYFSWLLLIILAAYFIHEKIPDKYLVPVIFSIAVFSNLAKILFIKKKPSIMEGFFLGIDFLIIIIILFFWFSYRFLKKEPEQNSEKRVEIIIKKLLWLILATIVAITLFFYLQSFL